MSLLAQGVGDCLVDGVRSTTTRLDGSRRQGVDTYAQKMHHQKIHEKFHTARSAGGETTVEILLLELLLLAFETGRHGVYG